MPSPSPHVWNFFRIGGLDQVALTTAEDLLDLDQLDQKLWVALSCPVKGLDLDEKTLALIDTDADGRIRVPELLAAVKWATARLRDPASLLRGDATLPLSAITDTTPEGKVILSSARQILANLGQANATAISVAAAADTAKIFASSPLNGAGIIPPEATDNPALQGLIKDIVACTGGTAARSGSMGVTADQIDVFFADLVAHDAWVTRSAAHEVAILGDATDGACAAIKTVRAKVEDYFSRCRVAAFDPRALAALNRSEADYQALAAKELKHAPEEVAAFPLAHIAAGQPLPLLEAVNPAWADAVAALYAKAVVPVFGADQATLTAAEWAELNAKFAAYETWLGGKAGSSVEKLGLARIREILGGAGRPELAALVARDQALEPEFKAVADVERLARYHRDLRELLHNFVNFADFYSRDRQATFQAGTLYLDSRSTDFCLRVDGPNPLAAMSKAYIAYCSCTRTGSAPLIVAACFTQGDSDYIFVGRHGVFYDRAGRDWDAVITSIVDNPISIRQAFWAPYKKLIRMIEEQVAKRAAAADAESANLLAATADKTANADKLPPVAASGKIDIGTVAALGVAVGAIGGALGAVVTGLAKLAIWQLPLVIVALMLVISLPSMAIAWLKLRQRTIGPILEGNGWAVNGRVLINIPLGTSLTRLAEFPPGSHRSLDDPYEDKAAAARRRRALATIFLLAVLAGAIWARWNATQHPDATGHPRYFWQDRTAPASPAPAPSVPAKAG
ncbi:MAG: hypothetical protein ACHQ4G_00355 [Opitutales bacterium]